MIKNPRQNADQYTEQETARRRDEALRRALNSPPKPHKDMKKGMRGKKRQDERPTASDAKRD